jgi:hypothetical protein
VKNTIVINRKLVYFIFPSIPEDLLKAKQSMSMTYPTMSGYLLYLAVYLGTCGDTRAANLNEDEDVVTVFINK